MNLKSSKYPSKCQTFSSNHVKESRAQNAALMLEMEAVNFLMLLEVVLSSVFSSWGRKQPVRN